MSIPPGKRLRMAAIDFLNPAPLMWNFEHPPADAELLTRYRIDRMTPAACAAALESGQADLGLIPIGAYAAIPDLAVVPGCAIASLGAIRSLLLVIRSDKAERTGKTPGEKSSDRPGLEPSFEADQEPDLKADQEPDFDPPTATELNRIRTVALDTASRTTALYTQILFRRFWGHTPVFLPHPPALDAMLASADAALLIGDPALYALRDRAARFKRTGEPLRYLDLGHLWRQATGTAWVSAFWAIRHKAAATHSPGERAALASDLKASRDAGLSHIPQLVAEWAPRLSLSPQTVETYLTRNIHYALDDAAIAGVERFFAEAHALNLIPSLPRINWMV